MLRKCISWKRQDNIEESSTERNKEKRIKKNVNNPISYGISSSTTKKIEREGRERDFVLKDINSNRANIKKSQPRQQIEWKKRGAEGFVCVYV